MLDGKVPKSKRSIFCVYKNSKFTYNLICHADYIYIDIHVHLSFVGVVLVLLYLFVLCLFLFDFFFFLFIPRASNEYSWKL